MGGFDSKIATSGINIYNSNSTVGAGRIATLTDELRFIVPSSGASSGVKIGNVSTNTSAASLYVTNPSVSQYAWFRGADNTVNYLIRLLNSSGTEVGAFRNNGSASLSLSSTSLFSIGAGTLASTKLYVRGTGTTVATTNQRWDDQAGTHLMSLTDNGELKFGIPADTFLIYNSALGRYEIGNSLRVNFFVGTDHIFPNNIWYNSSRAGATADTGHTLGLYTLTNRALGDSVNPQLHHYFNTVGATNASSVLGRFANNSTTRFEIFGDGRIYSTRPVYADDAAAGAGGLTTGFEYTTPTGEIRIKL